ncbi:WRKY transcription factor [Quillaja saponaria]|uniref:WRKY transcription factor n=1 Tax=Quillaja saponaria TaxID=32244 RepID=A0AAD7LM18_QUISA|nr:WRKY transcription factor [Quillaja saponaria]
MENLLFDQRKEVEDELSRGCKYAKQLQKILNETGEIIDGANPVSSIFAEDLMMGILRSFTNTLLVLNHTNIIRFKEVSDQGDFLNISNKELDGRKRRRSSIPTWETKTPSLIDDGQVWRKYGQKVITNAKYPRHYYRCTNKFDQGCKAMKQVQKFQEDPLLYRTTYYGHHTCRNLHDAETIILDSVTPSDPSDSSILLSFANTNSTNPIKNPFLSTKLQEQKESLPGEAYFQSGPDLRTLDFEPSGTVGLSSSASLDQLDDHEDLDDIFAAIQILMSE